MSVWSGQRIPIVVNPLPGEALDSWVEAYARRLRCSSAEFLDYLGLEAGLPRMLVVLDDEEEARLSEVTGVSGRMLRTMTLEGFDGLAITIRRRTRGLAMPPTWRRMAGSRFCPPCLAETEGRWQLAWRLPWSFACLRHQALLVEVCPSCRKRPVPRGPGRAGAWPPAICTGPAAEHLRGERSRCGTPLTDIVPIALPAGGLVLEAQRYVDSFLHGDGIHAGPGRENAKQTLVELFILARKSLSALHSATEPPDIVRRLIAESGGTLPQLPQILDAEDAHTVAVGAAVAAIAHRVDEPECDQVLNWIVTASITTARATTSSAETGYLIRPWRPVRPPLMSRVLTPMDPHMLPGVRLRYASASPMPSLPTMSATDTQRRAAMIPAALWPSWSMRLLRGAEDSTVMRAHSFRSALSVMLLLPGTLMTYQELGALLGGQGHQPSIRTIGGTFDDAQLTLLFSALAQLAYGLDRFGSPIDYDRRRALVVAERPRIDHDAYERACARHGWLRSTPGRIDLLDDYLVCLLTGARPTSFEGAQPSWDATLRWNMLRYRMPEHLREFLEEQALAILANHRIEEPLQWDPPVEWVDGITSWSGCDPERVNGEKFRGQPPVVSASRRWHEKSA